MAGVNILSRKKNVGEKFQAQSLFFLLVVEKSVWILVGVKTFLVGVKGT